MKRVTVTLPDSLEQELDAYLAKQETPPSISTVLQVALREYLHSQRLREREYRPGRGVLKLPVAEEGSGKSDVSINHDKYFAGK
jgi:metal-responsive CopG/Arc/MetJ family transcriptional regulator